MTQTTYIEPEGFKGTPGELILSRDETPFIYSLHVPLGKRYSCNRMYCRIFPDYGNGITDTEALATAQLFAASKDLLRELQAAAGLLEAHEIVITEEDYPQSNKQLREVLTNTYTAINKALGNPSNTTDNG